MSASVIRRNISRRLFQSSLFRSTVQSGADASAPQPAKAVEDAKKWAASDHVEVTLRLTLSFLFGYAMSVARIPSVVPPMNSLLLGVIVALVGMLLPSMMFSFGALVLPIVFTLFVLSYALSTALLAGAVAGGSAAFVVLFALSSLWISSLRFDKFTGPGTSIAVINLVFNAVLAFPNYRAVQDGFVVRFDGADFERSQMGVLSSLLSDFFRDALADAVAESRAEAEAAMAPATTRVGGFAHDCIGGVDVEVDASPDGGASARFPGGMWMVKAMWTCTGTTNPFAVYANNMIMLGWVLLAMALVSMPPPFSTMRKVLSRGILPGALDDVAKHLRLIYGMLDPEEAAPGRGDGAEAEKQKAVSLLKYANILFGGKLAGYTAFEPRLLRCGPPECSHELLVRLSDAVSKCIVVSTGFAEVMQISDGMLQNRAEHEEAAATLELCAGALRSGKALDGEAPSFGSGMGGEPPPSPDAIRMKVHAAAVVDATNCWMAAMAPPSRSISQYFSAPSVAAMIKNATPWVDVHLSWLKVLTKALLVNPFDRSLREGLCQPPHIGLVKLVWCVKFAFGMTVLVAMTVYWPAFRRGFVVSTGGGGKSASGSIASLNAGWAIVAYCFATTQTTEGTIKKGLLRLAGTVTGGFAAWLGLLACEDSAFDGGFNPCAVVAWLTVTSSVCVYASTERGFLARLGLSADYSFGPFYFVITELIVVLTVVLYTGPESRHDVAINRMVSNLVGIAVAILLSLVPPCLWGGDPRHCRAMARAHRGQIAAYLRLFLEGRGGDEAKAKEAAGELDGLRDEYVASDVAAHALVLDLSKDADRLARLGRLFPLDPKLKLEVARTARDVSTVSLVAAVAERILTEPQFREKLSNEREVISSLEALRDEFEGGGGGEGKDRALKRMKTQVFKLIEEGDSHHTGMLLELLLRLVEMLRDRLNERDQSLDRIVWGYSSLARAEG